MGVWLRGCRSLDWRCPQEVVLELPEGDWTTQPVAILMVESTDRARHPRRGILRVKVGKATLDVAGVADGCHGVRTK